MNSIYIVAQFITYFRKVEKQRSRTTWVQWREIVEEIYREKYFQGKIKTIINSGTADSSKIQSTANFISLLSNLSESEKTETLQLIHLYLELLKKDKDLILAEKLDSQLKEFYVAPENNDSEIQNTVLKWISDKEEDKFYFKIKLDGTLLLVLLDFFLRWISLWNYKTNSITSSEINETPGIFLLSQLLIIPVIIFLISYFRDKNIIHKTQEIFKNIGRKDLKIINNHSPWNYLICFLILIIGTLVSVISLNIAEEEYPVLIPIFAIVYGLYLIVILSFFSKKRPSISLIMTQLERINLNQVKNNLNHNENDEEIIELDVSLRSANDKMEAYVLEAALFGALAFSGFLQLISSSNVSIESLGAFSTNIYTIFEELVNFSIASTFKSLEFLLSKDGILSLMAFLTLFCSVFFLAVIASRLRFNDLADAIDRSLQLSKIYNEKEENSINVNSGIANESSNFFTNLIRKHLIQGNLSLEQTFPIMEFMRFFRTLGIFTFFVIVVAGGLFVSTQLSMVLAFIMLISFLFFKLKLIVQYLKNVTTQFQEFYFRVEKKVFYFIIGSVLLCFVLRSFNFDGKLTQTIIVISFLIIFIHYLLSLFIPEKLEDAEITESIFMSGNRNKIALKKLYKISLAVLFLGLMFKIMHFPGAGLLLMVGVFLLAGYFIFGQKTTNNNKFLGFIYRTCFSLTIIGGIFFMMHWPGAGFVRLVSIVSLILGFILLFFHKKQLLQTTKNITITFVILACLLQFPLFRFALTTLSFNYPIYLEKMEIAEIRTKITGTIDLGYVNAKTKPELDSLKYYMNLNDKIIDKINPHELNDYCYLILENQSDTSVLNHGLKWSNWIIKQDQYYTHYLINIQFLIKLKEYNSALNQLKILEKLKFDEDEKSVLKEIKELKEICYKNLPLVK
jgi:hypothetical protein